MTDFWEQCIICGETWPEGARTECPYYRNGEHRRRRTNVRATDVLRYDRDVPPDLPLVPSGQPRQVDYDRLAIVVSTHNRPKEALAALDSALASVPNYRLALVIGNHPNDAETVGRAVAGRGDARVRFLPSGRPPEHEGRLAETWNLAFQWAFRDPAVDWFWGMHDDMLIRPGWPCVVESHAAEVYASPFGDTCMLLSRRAFNAVGWYDERYTCRDYHDCDWQLRALWKLGADRVVLENEVHLLRWILVNPLGLSRYWTSVLPYQSTRTTARTNRAWYMANWAAAWLPVVDNVDTEKAARVGPSCADLNWYPWFSVVR